MLQIILPENIRNTSLLLPESEQKCVCGIHLVLGMDTLSTPIRDDVHGNLRQSAESTRKTHIKRQTQGPNSKRVSNADHLSKRSRSEPSWLMCPYLVFLSASNSQQAPCSAQKGTGCRTRLLSPQDQSCAVLSCG